MAVLLFLCGCVSALKMGLCVFLLLHIWWGVNLVLRLHSSLGLFMPPFSSPSAPPALWCHEWVLMFHDLHCIPFCVWMGAHLKLSVVILLLYWCPYAPLLSSYDVCVCVLSWGVLLVSIYLCALFFSSFFFLLKSWAYMCLGPFHSPTHNPLPNKVLMKGTKRFGCSPLAL